MWRKHQFQLKNIVNSKSLNKSVCWKKLGEIFIFLYDIETYNFVYSNANAVA